MHTKLEGTKYDKGKTRFDLLPFWAIEQVALIYTFGVEKYGEHNWLKGMKWSRLIGALFRHVFKWLRGQSYDEETGIHHLAHAAWQCFALMEYERNNIGMDDRVPYNLDLLPDKKEQEKRIQVWQETIQRKHFSEEVKK